MNLKKLKEMLNEKRTYMKMRTFNKIKFMSTITQIRRSNLIRLKNHVQKEFEKNDNNKNIRFTGKIFCEIIGISPSTFSQLKKSKHKPYFNEIYARAIEARMDLELGWFDIDRDSNNFNALRLNYKQFSEGLKSYHRFMSSKKIKITDNETLEKMRKELFLFLHKNYDFDTTKVTESDFLNFIKD